MFYLDVFNVKRGVRSSDGSLAYCHTVAIFIVVPYPNQVKSTSRIIVPIWIKSRKKGYSVLKNAEISKECLVRQGSSSSGTMFGYTRYLSR